MYRIIMIPYANAAQADAEMAPVAVYNPRVGRSGRYAYAFQTLQEARTVAMQHTRNYTQGYTVFILDDEAGIIVDEARSERRPAMHWKGGTAGAVAAQAAGKAATTKGAVKGKRTAKA